MTAPSPPFAFPPFHSFPPFYTPQPSLTTEHSRLSKWSALLLSYSRHHRIHKLVLVDALDTDLFHNKTIKRRLALADARDVLEFMRKEGRAEWVGGRREREEGREAAWVYWRTPEEWAALVYEWVDGTGQKNTVLTLYELIESEATMSQEFHGIDVELLQKAMQLLVKRGKAQLFGQEDEQGVKFF